MNEAAASIDPYIGPLSTFNIYPPPLTRVNEGQHFFFLVSEHQQRAEAIHPIAGTGASCAPRIVSSNDLFLISVACMPHGGDSCRVHEVECGDSLSRISELFDIPLSSVLDANPHLDADWLQVRTRHSHVPRPHACARYRVLSTLRVVQYGSSPQLATFLHGSRRSRHVTEIDVQVS